MKQQILVSEDFVELVEKLASLTPKGLDKEVILSTAQGFISLCNNDLTKARNFLSSSKFIMVYCLIFSLLSANFAFANSLDPDQDRHNVCPDPGPNCSTLVFLKEFIEKKLV